ncbi:MAG: hypothetical protein R3B60_02785 [Candidatus Paceibacterota bacterium]
MPIVFIIIGVIILALGYTFFFSNDTKTDDTTDTKTEVNTTKENNVGDKTLPTSSTPQTFTQKATYVNPSRKTQEIEIILEVNDGMVTNSQVKYDGKDSGYANKYQERFDEVYKSEVIGKKLDQIHLSRVGGASLTSEAFNNAVADIISQS